MFSNVPGPYWQNTFDRQRTGYSNSYLGGSESILAELTTLYEERFCTYQVLHHLVKLRIATEELYQDPNFCSPVYWFHQDCKIHNGDVEIDVSGGS